MNSLSILLYVADVLYTLTGVLTGILIFGWIIYALGMLAYKMWSNDTWSSDAPEIKAAKKKARERNILPKQKWFWLSGLVILFLTLVPSKDTFYMIVASEAGETVVNTPEAKEIMSDVKEIIDIQLEKLKQ